MEAGLDVVVKLTVFESVLWLWVSQPLLGGVPSQQLSLGKINRNRKTEPKEPEPKPKEPEPKNSVLPDIEEPNNRNKFGSYSRLTELTERIELYQLYFTYLNFIRLYLVYV
jgi:hypothetical protein